MTGNARVEDIILDMVRSLNGKVDILNTLVSAHIAEEAPTKKRFEEFKKFTYASLSVLLLISLATLATIILLHGDAALATMLGTVGKIK